MILQQKKKKLHTYKHVPFQMYKHYKCLNIFYLVGNTTCIYKQWKEQENQKFKAFDIRK